MRRLRPFVFGRVGQVALRAVPLLCAVFFFLLFSVIAVLLLREMMRLMAGH